MPSTIGHLLGGVAAAWTVDLVPGDRTWRTAAVEAPWYRRVGGGLTIACATIAAAPDLDVVWRWHRAPTHSVVAIAVAACAGAIVAARTRRPMARVALMFAAALASHLLLDWLGVDNRPPRGIQMFWPFSDRWFISDLDVFPGTARERPWTPQAMRINLIAVAQEVAIMLPLAVALWVTRAKAFARDKAR